jgi:hypothetical protein
MVFVVKNAGERVVEYRACLIEANAVLLEIGSSLPTIPFEAKNLTKPTTCRSFTEFILSRKTETLCFAQGDKAKGSG